MLAILADDVSPGWILSKFFVEKAFSEEAKHFGDHIVSEIKVQFIKKLKGAEWMSKNVRDLGIEKGVCSLFMRQLSILSAYNLGYSSQHHTEDRLSHEKPRHPRLGCPGRLLCRCQHYQ